jgi:hypothetical protein
MFFKFNVGGNYVISLLRYVLVDNEKHYKNFISNAHYTDLLK